jgi:hypothetical protein
MTDTQLLITVSDIQTGEQWSFQDDGACPTLEKGMTGDGGITWSADFQSFTDRLPPRHAHVVVTDDLGIVQTGRLVRRTPPGTDICDGPAQYGAEGYAASLGDRKHSEPTTYGPTWESFSFISLFPEGAVSHSVSQLGSNVSIGTISPSGFTMSNTESYQGRTAQDTANAMASMGAGLSTPFVWSVRKGVFNWGPVDLAPRYQTSVADGATFTATDDASRLYTRVIVLWGAGQSAVWPGVVTYGQLPTIVDLVVNAGAEIKTPAGALQLAQGLYGRLGELELGWSWNFSIPGTTAIERMDAGYILRVPDLDATNRWGTKHPCPDELLVTSCRWDGNSGMLTGTCGEIRDPSHFVKQVMYGQTPSAPALFGSKPNEVRRVRDAGKIEVFGPYVAESSATGAVRPSLYPTSSPAPIDYKIPAVDTKQDTQHPVTLPPMPPPVVFHDGDPTTSGVKTKFITAPVKALSWTLTTSGIQSDYRATLTRRSNGAVIATLDLAGTSEKIDQVIGFPTNQDSTIGLVETDDILIYTVTTPASSTSMTFVAAGVRNVRHFPGYAGNAHPITGGRT